MPVVGKQRVRMIIPVWGPFYIDRWLGFSFASLRSSGNIPYLNEHFEFELAIITRSSDAEYMQSSARFKQATQGLSVKFIIMDEFFPRSGQIAYGVPLTLAYAKAILDLGGAALGTYVILMNADVALASGSLKSIADRIDEGCAIVTAQAIRAIDGPARSELGAWYSEDEGVLSISSRSLMQIIGRNLHSTITARIVNEPTIVDSTYYHQIFWRISEDCLAMRAFLIHPLCFRVERMMEKVVCPVDYGFISEFCPSGKYCSVGDSDDYLMIELQERNSEAHLLRVTPNDGTANKRLARLEREIALHAQGWTTAEHRRSLTQTFLYHEKDLPSDIAQRLAPFDAFIRSIEARLSPAVSHIGHFQWLPAVRIYRQEMQKSGNVDPVPLLNDPRNGEIPKVDAAH
jgi:hypothetical protein